MYNMKKKMMIIIPIIVVCLVAIILTILYFTTDLFKSKEELFWKYLSQADDINEIIQNDKEDLQENFRQTNSYTSSGNIAFVLTQGEDSLKQFNATTSSRHDVNTNRTYADITLKNGELDLINVSYAHTGDIYAIKCDEVFGSFVGIQNSNLTELCTNYGISNVPNSIDKNEYSNLLELTDAQKRHILDTYIPIVRNHINSEEYEKSKESIEINGRSYNANVYELKISGSSLKEIIIDCLNNLKTDTESLMLISEKMSKLGFIADYTDVTNITAKIDEIIEKLQSITIKDDLIITVYENGGNNIRTDVSFGDMLKLIYNRLEDNYKVSADIMHEREKEKLTDDEVIDLNALAQSNMITTRVIIEKNINNNMTTNNIEIIPNVEETEKNINILISMGNIQNNNINNSYSVIINTLIEDKVNTVTITYDDNIIKADSVEEIIELSGSNTAIANNYTKEQFTVFIKNWGNIFINKLSEKMTTLGLEEISSELEKIVF